MDGFTNIIFFFLFEKRDNYLSALVTDWHIDMTLIHNQKKKFWKDKLKFCNKKTIGKKWEILV